MKLNKQSENNKQRLNILCCQLGFEKLRGIVHLSGSSLGQYLAFDCLQCIPEPKLQLAEAQWKLSQKVKS